MLISRRRPRDAGEQMVLNNYLTMQRIHALKTAPLTLDILFELHRLVTADTLDKPDGAGRLRRADERIAVVDHDGQVLHEPPPAHLLPERLQALCDFANGRTPGPFLHPGRRAIILHFWLAYDHPFVDGNGRTARALFYWSMLRSGYWLFEYVSISEVILSAPVKYGRAFLLRRFIEKRTGELRAVDSTLRHAADRFNHRQRALLAHAVRHPGQVYTIAGHKERQGVVYQTARTDLLGLADAGLLVKREAGKKLVFRPAPDLERRLRELGEAEDMP
jgi:Fic family protein